MTIKKPLKQIKQVDLGEMEEESKVKRFVPQYKFASIIVQKEYNAVLFMWPKYMNKITQTKKEFNDAAYRFNNFKKDSVEYSSAYRELGVAGNMDIVQYFKDNENAEDSYKYAKEAVRILDASLGANDQYDLTTANFNNITESDLKNTIGTNRSMRNMLREGQSKDPRENYIGFFFISGEGINKNGK